MVQSLFCILLFLFCLALRLWNTVFWHLSQIPKELDMLALLTDSKNMIKTFYVHDIMVFFLILRARALVTSADFSLSNVIVTQMWLNTTMLNHILLLYECFLSFGWLILVILSDFCPNVSSCPESYQITMMFNPMWWLRLVGFHWIEST